MPQPHPAIARLEQAGLSLVLDTDIMDQGLVEMTELEWSAVEEATADGLTLREGLTDRTVSPMVRDICERIAEQALSLTQALPGAASMQRAYEGHYVDVVDWLEANRATVLLDLRAQDLVLDTTTTQERNWEYNARYYCRTVDQLLQRLFVTNPPGSSIQRVVVNALAKHLVSIRRWTQVFDETKQAVMPDLTDDGVGRWTRTAFQSLQACVDDGHVSPMLSHRLVLDTQDLRVLSAGHTLSMEPDWDATVAGRSTLFDQLGPRMQRAFAADLIFAVVRWLHADTDAAAVMRTAMNRPAWERALDRMDRALAAAAPPTTEDRVVAFRVSVGHLEAPSIRVASAKSSSNGRYRARNERDVSAVFPYATPQERPLLERMDALDWTQRIDYALAELLVGHPRVLPDDNRSVAPIPVRRAALTLHIDRTEDAVTTRWHVGGTPRSSALIASVAKGMGTHEQGLLLLDDSVLWVVPCSAEARQLAVAMGSHFDHAGLAAAGPLLSRLQGLGTLVNVAIGDGLRGKRIDGDGRLVVRTRFDGGLQLTLRVHPLPEAAAQLPGEGPDTLHAMRDGQPVYVQRDLHAEVHLANDLANELDLGAPESPFTWFIDALDDALTAVHALAASPHRLEVDGTLPSTRTVDTPSVTLRVKKERGWFTVGGSAALPGASLDLQTLLDAVADDVQWMSTASGYVRLTDALKGALASLNATRRSGKTALSAVHAPLIEALQDAGATVDGVAQWVEATERLARSRTLEPHVPDALNGTLRSYQQQGFAWLARLAHWAPGAVLADDMGLGKTIQSIALLLRRASDGPALVVAPTSVGFNWTTELERFAPSLTVQSYRGSNREDLLATASAGTVFVTSYGILVRDADRLAETPFATVVFDEAQALKNPSSQRAKAAMGLDVAFRLGLSGTPVENHVDDLWSVFACTVTGLLGSHAGFREQWAKPIDDGDTDKQRALSRVISPFLLRRTKTVVAPELPERTEVVHRVELAADHRALYERTRALAVARLAQADPKKARFQVLAELTRLRQMACDPRLSDPTSPVAGGKVRHLVRRLEDIRESGDKALVFSTFVQHLTLARDALTERGFRVQWLTGSTSADARKAAVDAFQEGDADVFLLSTKAGGTGLNLTAASYVFHLDPWWNPATEDQATDRAHRIGQDKPVTVYRLIAADTVEERILDMQQEKRELVDALLSDSGRTTALSVDDLRALLSGEWVPSDDEPTPSPVDDAPQPVAPRVASTPSRAGPSDAAQDASPANAVPTTASAPGVDDDWLDRAIAALDDADIKATSRGVYVGALRYFDSRTTHFRGPMVDRYERFAQLGDVTVSRLQAVRAALRKAGMLSSTTR